MADSNAGPGVADPTRAPGKKISVSKKISSFGAFSEKIILFPSFTTKSINVGLHISPVKSITTSIFFKVSSPPGLYCETGPQGSVGAYPLTPPLSRHDEKLRRPGCVYITIRKVCGQQCTDFIVAR